MARFNGITAIPSRIDVDSIADIVTRNRISGKTCILRLITRTGNPEYIVTAISTHQIYYFLKISCQILKTSVGIRTELSVIIHNLNRLIGKFKHYVRIISQSRLCRDISPHPLEIFMISIPYFYFFRTYARRPHNNIQPFRNGIFGHRNEHL